VGEPPDRLAPFGGAKPAAPTCLGLPGCVVAALPGQIRTARTAWEGVGPAFPGGAARACLRSLAMYPQGADHGGLRRQWDASEPSSPPDCVATGDDTPARRKAAAVMPARRADRASLRISLAALAVLSWCFVGATGAFTTPYPRALHSHVRLERP
jgi:hypothetical protein